MRRGLVLGSLVGLVLALPAPGLGQARPGAIVGEIRGHIPQRFPLVAFVTDRLPGSVPAEPEAAVLDQQNRQFWPRVLPVEVGTTVRFHNGDPFKHNIFSPDGERFNLGTWPQGGFRDRVFKREGVYRHLCNIHPEMLAYVLVLPNRAYALVNVAGRFTIPGIPSGLRTLEVWGTHLDPGSPKPSVRVRVPSGATASVRFDLGR